MTERYEWGIWHYRSNSIHRTGMTENQAREWIAEWEEDGGKVDAFVVVRRTLSDWLVPE